ncbi:MAG TPA: hypothetical protein VJS92_03745 [Candidatus Polarisedimenticolaceae bacterium]|nr:hypothetical protein [Candidatus Polarisedimenticolaceae bacterium]
MSEPKSKLDEIFERLARERDELKLKIHLGKKDAADEWERLEAKWKELKTKSGPVREAAAETARSVAAEIKQGYEKIRNLL